MKLLGALLAICASTSSYAETTYLGLYLKGSKIGYSAYQTGHSRLSGQTVVRSDSKTVLNAGLLGESVSLTESSTVWATKAGKPLRMHFDQTSGGRSNVVDAVFSTRSISLNIRNGGVASHRSLEIPRGSSVVDDPLSLVMNGKIRPGPEQKVLVLDPSTASLMKTSVRVVGSARTTVRGRTTQATLIEVTDPRSKTEVFVDRKGELVRVDGPMGIYMLPVSKEVALAPPPKYQPSTDLAINSGINPDKPIPNPDRLVRLRIRLSSTSISSIPSDQTQTATKAGKGWVLDIHPASLQDGQTATLEQAAASKPEWLKPSLNVPCDAPKFKTLAAKIIGSKKTVQAAAFAIQRYVYENMKPNPGIGVLRDATEVLASKEGVCRDYATLTVTLLRAAGIPARLASGLVNWDGTFYYHAWTEAWDGSRWIGVDSTTDRAQLSASHVKLGDGNVDTAFAFTFLEKAQIEVVEARRE